MWSRKAIKEAAKKRLSVNYWRMVLMALVIGFAAGGMGGASSGSSAAINSQPETSYSYTIEGEDGSEPETFEEYIEEQEAKQFGMSPSEMMDMAVAGSIIFLVLAVIFVFGIVLSVFLLNPLVVGAKKFFFVNIKEKADINLISAGFEHNYKNVIKILFLRDLYTFLWSLLFIIPGIIKSYEYRMIPYLLAEHPDMTTQEAFELTKKMMTGNKWKAFVFDFSFFGWHLLGALTCGMLSIFYVNPYFYQADAMLYDAIKYDCGMYPAPEVEPVQQEQPQDPWA